MMTNFYKKKFLLLLFIIFPLGKIYGDKNILTIQSTTSVQNSGLYDYLQPFVIEDLGLKYKVVASGTGAAIRNAMNCDGDVLLVHDIVREEKFISEGYSSERTEIMYNEFLFVGPDAHDEINFNSYNAIDFLKRIYNLMKKFVSRGDDSGTHSMEKRLWETANLNHDSFSKNWYLQTGLGMGETLNIAIGLGAITLVDRATWLSFSNKSDFKVLFQGDEKLFNPYSILLVSKNKCPLVKTNKGKALINWLKSKKGQNIIGNFRVNGLQLFTPSVLSDKD